MAGPRDKDIDDAVRSWAETRAKIAEMKEQLEELEAEHANGTESFITQVMEQIDQEMRRVDNIVVRVKKKNEGGRASYSKSFKFLLGKVNEDLKNMAGDFLESTKGDKWVKTFLQVESAERRKPMYEGIMKRVYDAIKDFAASVSNRLRGISGDISELERMEKEQTEAALTAKADVLIEAATKG